MGWPRTTECRRPRPTRCDGPCVAGECRAACLPIECDCSSEEQCCQDIASSSCEPAGLLGVAAACCRRIGQLCADASPDLRSFACCNRPPDQQFSSPIRDAVYDVGRVDVPGYRGSFDQCGRSTGAVACRQMPAAYSFRGPLGCYCCKPAGAECSNNAIECCGGYCVDGFCPAACIPNGESCRGASHTCCSYSCNGLDETCEPF